MTRGFSGILLLSVNRISLPNKTENHFSPYPSSQSTIKFVEKAPNRNVLLIAEKACKKLPSAAAPRGASAPWGVSAP
jgi:hypothetical protein